MEIQEFVNFLVKEAKLSGRYSTANTYISTWRSFHQFTEDMSIQFEDITQETIKLYEQYLLLKGCRYNTISIYMRMLRSICNQAVARQLTHLPTKELFSNVFIGYETTTKRAIRPTVIRLLVDFDFKRHPQLEFSRDLFLLSFYLRGIPFIDLAYLRKIDVRDNNISYYRHKTGQQLCVTIESCARKIIKRYANKCKSSIYLLPVITESGEKGHTQYKSALRLYNKHLNQISSLLQLEYPLTSYVARHSWATTARQSGIPVSIISTGLGHTSEKVTYVYLDSFDNNTLSEANRKVIASINSQSNQKQKKLLLNR